MKDNAGILEGVNLAGRYRRRHKIQRRLRIEREKKQYERQKKYSKGLRLWVRQGLLLALTFCIGFWAVLYFSHRLPSSVNGSGVLVQFSEISEFSIRIFDYNIFCLPFVVHCLALISSLLIIRDIRKNIGEPVVRLMIEKDSAKAEFIRSSLLFHANQILKIDSILMKVGIPLAFVSLLYGMYVYGVSNPKFGDYVVMLGHDYATGVFLFFTEVIGLDREVEFFNPYSGTLKYLGAVLTAQVLFSFAIASWFHKAHDLLKSDIKTNRKKNRLIS